mgnify:CR=1 FL=1
MFLIAEAGVNHNGKLENALRLADAAKAAGADMVKYQFFDSKRLWGDDRIKHLELRFDDFVQIHRYCENIGIEFGCTAFGVAELTMLRPIIKRVKIASGMNKRDDFLEAVANTGLPVLLSTGMTTWEEMSHAFFLLQQECLITVLQCTSSYPCRLEDVNLSAMVAMKRHAFPIGLSDHTTSITIPIAAAALGASVIEKHFTLDREATGPDHKASITPREFKAMQIAIIEVEAAMGSAEKRVLPCEEALRKAWRK